MDSLGSRLKHVRVLAGIGSAELGEFAGLKSPSHVGMIERGKRPEIAAATAVALAHVLGVATDWLVTGEGPDPDPDAVHAAVERAREAHKAKPSEVAA